MPPARLNITYSGRKGPIFGLALKTGILTVLTLGIYRFWAKTRLRRYYWSAIRPGGIPLEYAGEPLEKLLGFLVAVVFLAFYIGVVNLILMYFSFALLNGNVAAYVLSFAGLAPIIFFAQYRARRYILARTRWRGIRFGLEPGAWGYAWRAMLHWLLAIATIGLLWPLTTLWLEKYKVSHTYYGDQIFVQGGRRGLLFGSMKHIYYPLGLSAVVLATGVWSSNPAWFAMIMLTGPWFVYGLAYWRADSFKRMTEEKELGPMRFRADPSAWTVVGIYALGWFLINLVFSGFALFMMVPATIILGSVGPDLANFEQFEAMLAAAAPLLIFAYFAIFLGYRAMAHAWITLPIAAHFAETTRILNAEDLHQIAQRDRDEFAEAEGFAEALDVGAAI
ncbi:DUF898 domain-containing protein [Aliiroseovarius sediminis]|uniref:DUF898 domain-containing protein n=1 Tax=Aliiroseovarius sediminis TaxID=2925839 RepID=UPI001F5950F2|nr:DUF898 domain-containing protein [Aliiroseovarius sediminis]MCI2395860.1 DUF898 domain-containing protein [Aliiroseovarius sediminis]